MTLESILANPIYQLSDDAGNLTAIEKFKCCPNCGEEWGFDPHPSSHKCSCGIEWRLVEITDGNVVFSLLSSEGYSIAYNKRQK